MDQPIGYKRDETGQQPPYLHPEYRSTVLRAPKRPLVPLPHTLSEITGPVYGHEKVGPLDHDLTRQHDGEPLGERIIVLGRVMDSDGRPVPDALMEIWQANSAGRYRHEVDNHPAPLDPNFSGGGRCVTDAEGRYRFVTIKPAAYPWGNDANAWRPAHIHFSLFGTAFATRLITQMYFPGDPLLACRPDLQLHSRRGSEGPACVQARPGSTRNPSGRWPTSSTSCLRGTRTRLPMEG